VDDRGSRGMDDGSKGDMGRGVDQGERVRGKSRVNENKCQLT